MAEHPRKCANPPCSCIPANGEKYCSAHCEGASERIEMVCHCGHADCKGEVTEA